MKKGQGTWKERSKWVGHQSRLLRRRRRRCIIRWNFFLWLKSVQDLSSPFCSVLFCSVFVEQSIRGRKWEGNLKSVSEIFCLAIEEGKNQFLHITSRRSVIDRQLDVLETVLTLFSFFSFAASKDTYCFEHLVESPRVTLGKEIELKDKEWKNVHNIRENYWSNVYVELYDEGDVL